MDEKALDNLSLSQLRQLVLSQQQELDTLRDQLQQAQAQLASRQLILDEAGSIAQAALQLSGVFEQAQQAADQYLENVESLSARQEADYRQRLDEAEQQAQTLLRDTQRQCRTMEEDARVKSDYYWDALDHKIAQLYREHPELCRSADSDTDIPAEEVFFGPDD